MKVIWINGLAGAGKSSTARLLCAKLDEKIKEGKFKAKAVLNIDGDEFREVLAATTSMYDKASRISVVPKRMRLCCILAKQEICVVSTAIALFKECYESTRTIAKDYGVEFVEIHIHCPLNELEKRDQKALYSKAKSGEIQDVVGVDIAYDKPDPDLWLDGTNDINENVEKILEFLGAL